MNDEQEKLEKERAERRKLFLDWPIEKELPQTIGEYNLSRIDKQEGRIYYAFGWKGQENGWEIRALFDEETMDYMVKMYLRMMTMTEIEVITGDFAQFQDFVKRWTPDMIKRELIERDKVSVLVKDAGFMNWDYSEILPPEIGAYKRMIEPRRPILGLNGSYIIACYECLEKNTGILFFYNMFRDEYYGELRAKGIPGIVHQYDAKSVADLAEKIKTHLGKDLEALYQNPILDV
jgi:hypothetical protein